MHCSFLQIFLIFLKITVINFINVYIIIYNNKIDCSIVFASTSIHIHIHYIWNAWLYANICMSHSPVYTCTYPFIYINTWYICTQTYIHIYLHICISVYLHINCSNIGECRAMKPQTIQSLRSLKKNRIYRYTHTLKMHLHMYRCINFYNKNDYLLKCVHFTNNNK